MKNDQNIIEENNKNKINDKNNKNEENSLLVKNGNENLDNSHDSNKSNFSFRKILELEISEKIKVTAFMIIGIAVFRIFSFEIFIMLGELLSSVIVFLYSIWNNKCMAILVAINGISGFVYSFISIFRNLLALKSENFGFLSVLNLIVSLFSTFIYGIVIYLAHYGFKHFELLKFGKHEDRHRERNANQNNTSQYGALDKDLNNSFSKADTQSIKNEKKEKNQNNISQHGALDKDLNNSFSKADTHGTHGIKNEMTNKEKNELLDNLGSLGEKAKQAGENFTKIKNGIDMLGDALNNLSKK
jgi:hypothetical protein